MENQTTNQQTSPVKSIISLVIFLGVVGGAIALAMNNKKDAQPLTRDEAMEALDSATTTAAATATPSVASTSDSTAASHIYKDGTYQATGKYNSPGGLDQVGVSLTLKDDVVVDSTFTPMAGDRRSEEYQAKFASGYKALVVGKNISEIRLGKVSGSSLTSTGFNAAVETIKAQAKS